MRQKVQEHLLKMYNQNQAFFIAEVINIDKSTRISAEQGNLLYQLCRQPTINKTLEIGFAYGFSTLFILEALLEKPVATH